MLLSISELCSTESYGYSRLLNYFSVALLNNVQSFDGKSPLIL